MRPYLSWPCPSSSLDVRADRVLPCQRAGSRPALRVPGSAREVGALRPALLRSGQGAAGAGLLAALAALSALTVALVPQQAMSDWNDPSAWLGYPKAAMPAWANALQAERAAEHLAVEGAVSASAGAALHHTLSVHRVDFDYDSYPGGFMHVLEAAYAGSPLLVLSVERPDGTVLELMRSQLPPSQERAQRSFSTDPAVRSGLAMQSEKLGFDPSGMAPAEAVFSDGRGRAKGHVPVRGPDLLGRAAGGALLVAGARRQGVRPDGDRRACAATWPSGCCGARLWPSCGGDRLGGLGRRRPGLRAVRGVPRRPDRRGAHARQPTWCTPCRPCPS